MATVTKGDTVKVHYVGRLADGEVFDSSRERNEPFIFIIGEEMVIPGFEAAVIGMAVGEKKTVTIAPVDGYGERQEEFVLTVRRNQFPPDAQVEIGACFDLSDGMGRSVPAVITAISGEEVTLDANHPLAGKTISFEIELIEIGCPLPAHHHHCGDGCGDGCCG